MYAIETELGRFEAENERQAKKLLKAAEAKAAAEAKLKEERQRIARWRAAEVAAKIMERYIDGDAPCGWRAYAPGDKYGAKLVEDVLHCDTEAGHAEIQLYQPKLTASLMNGAGWDIVVWLDTVPYAVGWEDGEHCLYELPSVIQPELYKGE